MSSKVITTQSAGETALAFLSQHHPGLEHQDVFVLELEQGWLVQADDVARDAKTAERVVLVVDQHGFVAEVSRNSINRQSAQRQLAALRAGEAADARVEQRVTGWSSTPPPAAGWQ
jgi:hypothetical protein